MRMTRPATASWDRPRTALAALAAAALLLAGCGGTDGAPDGTGAAAVVTLATGEPGELLTDGEGLTLYLFTADSPGVSTCTDGCLAVWPPLLTGGEPVAGTGVDAGLLGTLTREDGSVQVTYAGWPLYRYAGDTAPGELTGQGVGGVWFVVAPSGEPLGLAGTTTDATDTDADATDSGSGSGYGY
jgi:predicted lipoprotein with Yx(FWY)xxD motif